MNEDKTYYLWITLIDECIFGFMYEIELDKLEDLRIIKRYFNRLFGSSHLVKETAIEELGLFNVLLYNIVIPYSSNTKQITGYKIFKLDNLKTFESHINNLKRYAANDKYDITDRRNREIISHEDERLFYYTLTNCLYKTITYLEGKSEEEMNNEN